MQRGSPSRRRRANGRMSRRCSTGSRANRIARSTNWEQILVEHPRDVLAFRLAHFVNFWLGRPDVMLASVLRRRAALERGTARLRGASSPAAASRTRSAATTPRPRRRAARRSSAIPAICGRRMASRMCWRCRAGAARASPGSTACGGNWEGANNLRHHLWWHAAMFHLERGETDRVLALYDGEFRNLASPLTQALPDLYIDVQNAASMLFRLQRHGVDVGDRWVELADQGGGADRRLPVGVHPAALDDGAGRDRAGRGGASHAGGDARLRAGAGHERRWWRATRCRSARRCWRTRAANTPRRSRSCARRSAGCTGSAAATPSRTCSSSSFSTPR